MLAVALALPHLAAASLGADADLILWRLEGNRVVADDGAPVAALPVGSLQKPFVAKAWARAHPAATPPRFRCDAASGCWLASGHGVSDLARATTLSCNTYFRQLAQETPEGDLEATLRGEGFVIDGRLSPEAAIGLGNESASVTIPPAALLEAYRRLTREPWPAGDPVRRLVLAGLRDAALVGTAKGLGRRGYWAKTGTSAAIDGHPLATSGWALALDDSGWGILGLLPRGTGREAALRLAEPLARLVTGVAPHAGAARGGNVSVSLFDALRPTHVAARNVSGAPAATSRGYLGAGAAVDLKAGDRLSAQLWELSVPEHHMVRRIHGALACEATASRTLRVVAELEPREYVGGVLAAELPNGRASLREDLAAAVLRFLRAGPRHSDADVCDTTHCAWFVGHSRPLDDPAWARVTSTAGEPGPAFWTGHCGGAPLSPHAVWGNGDRRVTSCPRHGGGSSRPWTRFWSEADVAAAFGAGVLDLSVEWPDGVWTLEVRGGEAPRPWRYDEAHSALAGTLGWAGLPSPATRVSRTAGGWRAEGVGLGHRVGLCLGGEANVVAVGVKRSAIR